MPLPQPSASRKTWPVHSWAAGPVNSLHFVVRADKRVKLEDAARRIKRMPPLVGAARVERVHPAQRIATYHLTVLGRNLRYLVFTDQRVATDQQR